MRTRFMVALRMTVRVLTLGVISFSLLRPNLSFGKILFGPSIQNRLDQLRARRPGLERSLRNSEAELSEIIENMKEGVDPPYVEGTIDANPLLSEYKMRYDHAQELSGSAPQKWGQNHPVTQALHKQAERTLQEFKNYGAKVHNAAWRLMVESIKRNIADQRDELTGTDAQIRNLSEIIDETKITFLEYFLVKEREAAASVDVIKASATLDSVKAHFDPADPVVATAEIALRDRKMEHRALQAELDLAEKKGIEVGEHEYTLAPLHPPAATTRNSGGADNSNSIIPAR